MMVLALRERPVAAPVAKNPKSIAACGNPRCTDPACHPDLAQQLATGEILPETYLLLAPPAELILSDEPDMESPAHLLQLFALMSTFMWLYQDRTDIFYTGNASVYWTLETLKKRRLRGPDLFLVRNVTPKKQRNSWVVWAEDGRFPEFIIEILSRRTAKKDRTEKRELYQNVFRTPEYFWFHPETFEFMGLRLVDGIYQAITPDARGHRWSEVLGLWLGVIDGTLRFFDAAGVLVPTVEEAERIIAENERKRAELASQRAESEHQRVEIERQRADAEHRARLEAEEQLRQALARLHELETRPG